MSPPPANLRRTELSECSPLPAHPQEDEGPGSPGGLALFQFAQTPSLVSFVLSLRLLRLASLHSLDLSGADRWLYTVLAMDPTSVISSSCPAETGCTVYTVPLAPPLPGSLLVDDVA